MGYYGSLIDDLGNRVKDFDVAVPANRIIAGRYINRSTIWIYMAHHWEWRQKMGHITLIPNYTTGTCSVTIFNGSNSSAAMTVTFSGATLTSSMEGRFLKVDGEDYWHKIVRVDGSTAYLDSEITRATASGLTFKIWKRFYYLPGEVAAITDFGRWDNRFGRLEYKSFAKLVDTVSDVSDDGTPESFTPFGVDNYEPVYSAGTISIAEDANLVQGVDTVFLGNVLPGDQLVLSANTFTVKRVETDIRLVLNNDSPDVVPSTAYEIRRNLSIGFQFYPNEITDYQTIPYYYQDRIFNMVHETKDRPNLPDDFDDAILTRAEFKIKKDKGDSNWIAIAQLATAELNDLKINFRVVKSRYDTFAPETRGYPGRG